MISGNSRRSKLRVFLLWGFRGLPLTILIYSFFGFSFNQEHFPWWEISLLVKTDGHYELKSKSNPFSGEYCFTIHWRGSMEKDDSDYLLYQGEVKVKVWKGKERMFFFGFFSDFEEVDLAQNSPPELKVNYILTKKEKIAFDFTISGFQVPQFESEFKKVLQLPCSAQNEFINPHSKYNKSVINGSNQICLNEKEIYTGETVHKTFNWEWKKSERFFTDNYISTLLNFHKVEVELKIIPHLK